MKADTVELLGLFGKDVRYLVPLYQRNYKWNVKEHWSPLWDDIRAVAASVGRGRWRRCGSRARDPSGALPALRGVHACA